jgi:hypothetical protein
VNWFMLRSLCVNGNLDANSTPRIVLSGQDLLRLAQGLDFSDESKYNEHSVNC